jgi:hypothetical protein
MNSLCVALYSLHDDELRLNCFRDKHQLDAAIEILYANPERRFAVDVAFNPLDRHLVNALFEETDWRFVVSDRALALIPEIRASNGSEARFAASIAFHEAIWEPAAARDNSDGVRQRTASGWIAALVRSDKELAAHAARWGISNDDTYLANEVCLSNPLRVALARARYTLTTGSAPTPMDILDNLKHCPRWVTSRRFRDLALSVRQSNVLRANSLNRVGDLRRLGTTGLLKLPNLGLKSVRELGETVYQLLISEPVAPLSTEQPAERAEPEAAEPGSFIDGVLLTLRDQGGLAESIVQARWGLGVERCTLNELAIRHGLTRERIRQIEARAMEKLVGAPIWNTFSSRVEEHLRGRNRPLRVTDLTREDPWFGDSLAAAVVSMIIQTFLDRRLFTFELNGVEVVSSLSESAWQQTVKDASLILGDTRTFQTEFRAEKLTSAMLVEKGAELQGTLLEQLGYPKANVHVAEEPTVSFEADDQLAQKLRSEMLRRDLFRTA